MHLTAEQQAASENTPPEQLRMLVNQSIEMLRLVAQNPNTEPELLRELADITYMTIRETSIYKTIREAVMSNPNTPTDVLLELGSEFPGQLLNNPVFSLLMLENPNLLAEMPWKTQNNLYEYQETPAELRKRLREFIEQPF